MRHGSCEESSQRRREARRPINVPINAEKWSRAVIVCAYYVHPACGPSLEVHVRRCRDSTGCECRELNRAGRPQAAGGRDPRQRGASRAPRTHRSPEISVFGDPALRLTRRPVTGGSA
ncbi:hypothetical protein AOLI_G00331010 [Acnodon oligacanthus]